MRVRHKPKTDAAETASAPELASQVSSSISETKPQPKEASDKATGLNWLKYAGIGPRRAKGAEETRKLSGEAITSLGSLEAELLGVLWEIDRPATGMDVMERSLYNRRARGEEPTSFATIATTLRRLNDKGILHQEKGAGRTPLYVPAIAREDMAARILNNVSVTLLGHSLHGLLPKLVGNTTIQAASAPDSDEQRTLERLMKALEEVADSEPALPEQPTPAAKDQQSA